jgi:hypothetical protein
MKNIDAYLATLNRTPKYKPMVPPQRGAGAAAWCVLAICLIALLCVVARAQQVDVTIGLPNTTTHTPSCDTCNENNHLLLASYTHSTAFGVTAGTFVNSYDERSYIAGLHYSIPVGGVLEFRPSFGFVSGYADEQLDVPCGDTLCPIVAIDVTLWASKRIGFTRLFMGGLVYTDAGRFKVWGDQ